MTKEGTRVGCDGCLDTSKCWVCLGNGMLETPGGPMTPCHRCFSTGKCTLCQPISVIDLGNPVGLRTDG